MPAKPADALASPTRRNPRRVRDATLALAGALKPEPDASARWLPSWQAFVTAVDSGSMAAAARTLGCTRAHISKQIGELEAAFGVRLLERSTRSLRLTPPGALFHQHALQVLESVASTQIALRNHGDTPHGVLRISATLSFGRLYMAPLLPRLAAAHPELTCELVLTDHIVDLDADGIDLALRMTRSPPQDAVARKLATLTRGIYGAPDYLRAHGTPQSVAELAQHTTFSFLLTDEHRWHLIGPGGEEAVHRSTARVRFNSTDCLLDAALAGHGLAILPDYLAGPYAEASRLVRVLPAHQPSTHFGHNLYACYTPSRVRIPKVRVLLDALHDLFEPVPPWQRVEAPVT